MRIADVPQQRFLTISYRVRRHPHHRLAPAGSPAKRSPKFQMPSNRPRSDYSPQPLVQPRVVTTITATRTRCQCLKDQELSEEELGWALATMPGCGIAFHFKDFLGR